MLTSVRFWHPPYERMPRFITLLLCCASRLCCLHVEGRSSLQQKDRDSLHCDIRFMVGLWSQTPTAPRSACINWTKSVLFAESY